MGVLAKDKNQLIYIYSEDSRLGTKALSYIRSLDKSLQLININKSPLPDTVWIEIADLMDVEVEELFKSDMSAVTPANKKEDYKVSDWLKMIEKEPSLLLWPIAIVGTKAIQIKKSIDVYSLYEATGGNFDKSPEAIKNGNHGGSPNTDELNEGTIK